MKKASVAPHEKSGSELTILNLSSISLKEKDDKFYANLAGNK